MKATAKSLITKNKVSKKNTVPKNKKKFELIVSKMSTALM